MILIYGINGQSGRVISVTIFTSYFACVFWIYFTLPLVAKKPAFLRYFVAAAAFVVILRVTRKSILFCLLLYLEVTFSVIKILFVQFCPLFFSSKKLTVECYQSLIRLKKFSKPTRTSMVSSGLSARRRVTRSVAQRSELVAIMGCGVDLQHLVTVSRKYLQLSFSFINICNYRKTFYRLTFTVVIYCSWLVWSSAFVLFRPTNSLETPLLGKLVKQRDLFCQAERPLKTRRSKTLPHKSHRYGIFTSNCHFFYCTSLSLCSLLLFTVITCGDPGTPLNGQQADVKNGYNYGGSVKFICKDNYTLSGTSEIFCEETKDWSSPTPKCWGKSKLTLN